MNKWIGSFAGLRFFIVLFLIFHHFDTFNNLNAPGWSSLMRVLQEGYLSVDFFFILSGFVVHYGYGERLRMQVVSSSKFLLYRAAHLYPLYFICILVSIPLYYGGWGALPRMLASPDFFVHLLMLQTFVPQENYAFQFNALGWAVSVEFFFYFCYLYINNVSIRKLNFLCALLWFVLIFFATVKGLAIRNYAWFYYICPVSRLTEFLLGVVLYGVYIKLRPLVSRWGLVQKTIIEFGGCCFLLLSIVIAIIFDFGWEYKWSIYYALPCAVFILSFSFDAGCISRLLSSRFVQYLGKISFPLYLVHQLCLAVSKFSFVSLFPRENYLLSDVLICSLFGLLLSIAVAIIAFHVICRPTNIFLRRLVDKFVQ